MMPTRVGIAGLGAIGRTLARALAKGMPGLELAGVAARDHVKARAWLDQRRDRLSDDLARGDARRMPTSSSNALPPSAIRYLPADAVGAQARHGAQRRRAAVPSRSDRTRRAQGGQIIVPTGALIGLDAVTAAAEGVIHSVRMVTRKPPPGLAGAPYLVENKISVEGLTEPTLRVRGHGARGRRGFPANVNVVAALSLAGIGPDRTMIEIWADPSVTRNCHPIEVESEFGALLDVDREHPVGKPEHRPDHRAVGDRGARQAARAAARRNLIAWTALPSSETCSNPHAHHDSRRIAAP